MLYMVIFLFFPYITLVHHTRSAKTIPSSLSHAHAFRVQTQSLPSDVSFPMFLILNFLLLLDHIFILWRHFNYSQSAFVNSSPLFAHQESLKHNLLTADTGMLEIQGITVLAAAAGGSSEP